jgi:hypothetical protein
MALNELKKLDTSIAAGPENISNKYLKGGQEDSADIITDLFNTSISKSFVQ